MSSNKRTVLIILAATICLLLAVMVGQPAVTVVAEGPPAGPALQEAQDIPGDTFGFGRPATEEEIAAWNTDVQPDGAGLPDGSGTVAEGAALYADRCSGCHGETGREGEGNFLGPFRTLVDEYDAETWPEWPLSIGNYWPYATSVFDYIRRAMPYNTPGVLTDDEVYALVAFLLHENGVIEEDAVMNAETIQEVEMPALQHYRPYDPRDTYPFQ